MLVLEKTVVKESSYSFHPIDFGPEAGYGRVDSFGYFNAGYLINQTSGGPLVFEGRLSAR